MSPPFCNRPKDTPFAFRIIRHTMTVLSISIATICVYIVKRSPTVTRVYANLLLVLLLDSVVADVFIQWVFDPVFLFPITCIYRNAPLINVPLSAAACVAIMQSSVATGAPIYFALFMYRHQSIAPPGSRFKFAVSTQIVFLSIVSLPYILLGPSFYIGKMEALERDPSREHLADDWDLAILDKMNCIDMRRRIMIPFWALFLFVTCFSGLFIVAVARHTFLLLRRMKLVSVKTQHLHRVLTRSLVVQALIPVTLVVLPFLLIVVLVVLLSATAPDFLSKLGE